MVSKLRDFVFRMVADFGRNKNEKFEMELRVGSIE